MQLHNSLPSHDVSLVLEIKSSLKDMKLVILDDDPTQIILLEAILKRAGFHNFVSMSDPRRMVEVFEREQPDLLLLDLTMPHLTGLEVIQTLEQRLSPAMYFPILVLTADCRPTTQEEALKAGVKDFLIKPFNVTEVLVRIQHLLELRLVHLQRQHQKETGKRFIQHSVNQPE
jgi:DNA-binding response OmpR family regulator